MPARKDTCTGKRSRALSTQAKAELAAAVKPARKAADELAAAVSQVSARSTEKLEAQTAKSARAEAHEKDLLRRLGVTASLDEPSEEDLRAWSVARVDLGLTDAEFWELTPREFVALLEREIERQKQKCETSANAGADSARAKGRRAVSRLPKKLLEDLRQLRECTNGQRDMCAQLDSRGYKPLPNWGAQNFAEAYRNRHTRARVKKWLSLHSRPSN